ncbi:hypothetical protein INT45_010952 [Circinella minor]|uniref:Uncharacterized protein n=1 Tax=Circinella minor TaxID=1195481 RepID=A0A8H7RN86_9FUNG|nr:hypothetical protein INT45_010952 [Circinella minor]
MESTITTQNDRPALPKPTRKISTWNLFVHLAFNGMSEEREEWGCLIPVCNRLLGATDSEVSAAYRRVKNDAILMEKLNAKACSINSQTAFLNSVERKKAAEIWRRDIKHCMKTMSALFEYDMCLLMSPRREEDWDQDIAFNTSDSSVYAVTKMGSIEEFTMRCKEYADQSQPMEQNDDDMEGVVEENENDGMDDVMEEHSEYKRPSHVIRHSIASYFKDKMMLAIHNKVNWKRFRWGLFERTIIRSESDGEERVHYRNKTHGVDIVGFDFGVDHLVAVKPDILDNRTLKVLQKLVDKSVNVPNNQKKVRIVKIPGNGQ